MKKAMFSLLMLLSLLTIADVDFLKTSGCGYDFLSSVLNIRTVSGKEVIAKVVETGRGDPAFNGCRITIGITQIGDIPADSLPVWYKTGINVFEVKEIAMKNGVLSIFCLEHTGNYIENEDGPPNAEIAEVRYNLSIDKGSEPLKKIIRRVLK